MQPLFHEASCTPCLQCPNTTVVSRQRSTPSSGCATAGVLSQAEKRVLEMVNPELYRVRGTYGNGDHFGEESCVLVAPSEETVVADSFCKCAQLYGEDLARVMEEFNRERQRRAGEELSHCTSLLWPLPHVVLLPHFHFMCFPGCKRPRPWTSPSPQRSLRWPSLKILIYL